MPMLMAAVAAKHDAEHNRIRQYKIIQYIDRSFVFLRFRNILRSCRIFLFLSEFFEITPSAAEIF